MPGPDLRHPPVSAVRSAVARALAEDLEPLGDVTSALLPPGLVGTGLVVSRAAGVLAGRRAATESFRQVDEDVAVAWELDDGDAVRPGDVAGVVEGPLASILMAERTALNFLCHLSGVATATRRWVDAVGGRCQVWDTRKTTPGLRALEKAAVRAGGGVNHRGNLSDWVLLKDNHLAALAVDEAVRRARAAWPGKRVHVECDTADQLGAALAAGADLVLLDNMAPEQVARCVAEVRAAGRPCLVEVSGGVTLDTASAYAEAGADLISSSGLTASAPALDLGLDVRTPPAPPPPQSAGAAPAEGTAMVGAGENPGRVP